MRREGFLDGLADYLIAVNRITWIVGSGDYGGEKITEYYNRDSANRTLLIPVVWRRVLTESPPPPPLPGGQHHEGPHGYYDGTWYKGTAYEKGLGYIEAYLWCRRTYGKQPAAAYPRSLEFYDQKIEEYIDTRKAYNEPVADILARFRSQVPN